MTRAEVKDQITKIVEGKNIKSVINSIVKNQKNKHLFDQVIEKTNYLNPKSRFSERIYHIVNDLYTTQICEQCKQQKVRFISFEKGYNRICASCKTANDKDQRDNELGKFLDNYLKSDNIVLLSRDQIKEKLHNLNRETLRKLGIALRKRENFVLLAQIILSTKYIPYNKVSELRLSERLFNIKMDLFEIPSCPNCLKRKVRFLSFSRGYRRFCSLDCENYYNHRNEPSIPKVAPPENEEKIDEPPIEKINEFFDDGKEIKPLIEDISFKVENGKDLLVLIKMQNKEKFRSLAARFTD